MRTSGGPQGDVPATTVWGLSVTIFRRYIKNQDALCQVPISLSGLGDPGRTRGERYEKLMNAPFPEVARICAAVNSDSTQAAVRPLNI